MVLRQLILFQYWNWWLSLHEVQGRNPVGSNQKVVTLGYHRGSRLSEDREKWKNTEAEYHVAQGLAELEANGV